MLRGRRSCHVNAVTLRNWSRQNLCRNSQLAVRCKNWLSTFAAAKTGHAEVATMNGEKQRFDHKFPTLFAREIAPA